MASLLTHSLPLISGQDQKFAATVLGPQSDIAPESSAAGSRTYVASRDARQINDTISTTFTGPMEKVDAYFKEPSGGDTLKKILNWLGLGNYSTIHKSASKSPEPGTGLWFLEGYEFQN